MEWRIPLSDLDFGPGEQGAVQPVVQGRWPTMGAVRRDFERQFSAYVDVKRAIAVSDATAALHLACRGRGAGAFSPSLTFVATADAVHCTGANMEAMKSRRVQSGIHYPPVHQFRIYRAETRQSRSPLPNTQQAAAREVSPPLYPSMTKADVKVVAQGVRDCLAN
ncbi:MAG TPA: DegT/DnrJ/EryC1/StrS family aminotransferase [Anaerolineales bacterium]|nr:DegT/DnrJ/EryC1/StrS family aminotransferase [Anaerolineales bacterium]